jgi:hypothetical protein
VDRRVLPVYRLITPLHLIPALLVASIALLAPFYDPGVTHSQTPSDGPQFKEWLGQEYCPADLG